MTMAYMNKYQSDDYRRDELIRIIEHSVEKLTLAELEALYYDMTTKSYVCKVLHYVKSASIHICFLLLLNTLASYKFLQTLHNISMFRL